MKVRCKNCGNTFSVKKGENVCPYCGTPHGKEKTKTGNRKAKWIVIIAAILVLLLILGRIGVKQGVKLYWQHQWDNPEVEELWWPKGEDVWLWNYTNGLMLRPLTDEESPELDLPEGQDLLQYTFSLTFDPMSINYNDTRYADLAEVYMYADGEYIMPCSGLAMQNMGCQGSIIYRQKFDASEGQMAFLVPEGAEEIKLVIVEHEIENFNTIVRHVVEVR